MRKVLVALVLVVLTNNAFALTQKEVQQHIEDCTVALVTDEDRPYCSGVVVSKLPTYILTAGHCVLNENETLKQERPVYEKSAAIRYGADPFVGEVVYTSDSFDIAVLLVRELTPKGVAEFTTRELSIGDPVMSTGFTLGMHLTLFGRVAGLDEENSFGEGRIVIDLHGGPGASGSALYDLEGRVVGIIVEKSNQAPIMFAIPDLKARLVLVLAKLEE